MMLKQFGLGVCLSLIFSTTTTPSMYLEPIPTKAFPIPPQLLVFAIPGTYLDPRLIDIMVEVRKELELREGADAPPILLSTHHFGNSIDLKFRDPNEDPRYGRLLWILAYFQAGGRLTFDYEITDDGDLYLNVAPHAATATN